MTTSQVKKIRDMRKQGYTLRAIASECGVSRQTVLNYCKKNDRGYSFKSIYPGIARWLREPGRSIVALSEEMGMGYQRVWNTISGKATPSKTFIDCILAVTGLTYEEAFAREDTTCADT